MFELEATAASAGGSAKARGEVCARTGCERRVWEDWDESGLCGSCALEHDLFNRARRWERAAGR